MDCRRAIGLPYNKFTKTQVLKKIVGRKKYQTQAQRASAGGENVLRACRELSLLAEWLNAGVWAIR
jgi:hypothetical protein